MRGLLFRLPTAPLGTGTTTVQSGASLDIAGLTIATPLTLNGTGFNNTGALRIQSGANTWSANWTLGSNATLNVIGGSLTVNGNISSNTLTKIGAGDLTIGGSGANSASLVVTRGKVILNKSVADVNSAATLTIGDDIGGDDIDVVQIAAPACGRPSPIDGDEFRLDGFERQEPDRQRHDHLGIGQTSSGDIRTERRRLDDERQHRRRPGRNRQQHGRNDQAAPATITGTMDLNNGNRTITVVDHASANS